MILAGTVTEIMSPKSETTITYSNDGSSKSGVGNFIVQSFIIIGKQRAIPALPIFTESVQGLKKLEKMTLEILPLASGRKYSEVEIYERMDFVMTDSTAHNLGVIQEVGTELGAESSPLSLVCNVHPLMMMQGKVKSVFKEIHDALGTGVIKECFMVDIDFRNDSLFEKALHCLTSFISNEFSSKPWNRQQEFDFFIKPKKNESLCLMDPKFNRLFDCALTVLYHLDDIRQFLIAVFLTWSCLNLCSVLLL